MTCCLLMPFVVPTIAAPAKAKVKVAKRGSSIVRFGHTVETATFTVGGKCKKGTEAMGGVYKDKGKRRGNALQSQHWEGGYSMQSAKSLAIARYRAIELANGGGIVDNDDPGDWCGVPHHHCNDDRRSAIVWSDESATFILQGSDGYAAYGRREFVGQSGISTLDMDRNAAISNGYVPSDAFQNLGSTPFGSEYTPAFRSEPKRACARSESDTDTNSTMAAAAPKGGALEFLIADTGCAHDLISAREARQAKLKLEVSDTPMRFQTANGDTCGDMVAPFRIKELGEMVKPYVLQETPSVISIGKRTMGHGYSFVWSAGDNPYFITPANKVISLDVVSEIPYVRRGSLLCKPRDAVDSDYYVRHGNNNAVPATPSDAPVNTDEVGSDGGGDGEAQLPPPPDVDVVPEPPLHEGDGDGEDEPRRRNLRVEAKSTIHLLTHRPHNPYCDVCNMGKMRDRKLFKGAYAARRAPSAWLDLITTDHLVSQDGRMQGLTGDRDAIVVKDLFTSVKTVIPVMNKSREAAVRGLRYFVGDPKRVKHCYTDGSHELGTALNEMSILHEQSRPGKPQNNSKIERTNLDVLEGTRCAMIQAGLPECFWPFAAPHYCFLENTSKIDHQGDVYPDGSPYRVAHGGEEPNVKRLPFGCEVIFIPSSTKLQDLPTKWEGVALTGVIAGYRMGPGYKWGGEYLVWSLRELTKVNFRVDARV